MFVRLIFAIQPSGNIKCAVTIFRAFNFRRLSNCWKIFNGENFPIHGIRTTSIVVNNSFWERQLHKSKIILSCILITSEHSAYVKGGGHKHEYLMYLWSVYEPALNWNLVIRHFECGDATKICMQRNNPIIPNFYNYISKINKLHHYQLFLAVKFCKWFSRAAFECINFVILWA